MTPFVFFLVMLSLAAFVAAQILLKHGMQALNRRGARDPRFLILIISGTTTMAVSYFLNLGLLQRLDLSYLYPLQGMSVILISGAAVILLREKLTPQLIFGSLLIAAGVVLVSMT